MKTPYLIKLNPMNAYIRLHRSIHSSLKHSLKMSCQLCAPDKFTPWENSSGYLFNRRLVGFREVLDIVEPPSSIL